MQATIPDIFNPRHRSLLRGNLLVWGSLIVALLLSRFPHTRATLLQLVPTAITLAGTADTVRCMQKRWNFYHAGVLLCLYMDLLAICLILFLLIYPYTHFLSTSN